MIVDRLRRIGARIEARTGSTALVRAILDDRVPGGARMWYVLGAVLMFLLALECVTGVFLAFYYAPAASTAWASVAYIQDQLTLGWLVRGLHSFGSSGMVVVTGLHMLQVLIFGAYKKPREMNWLLGLVLMLVVILFAMSGYALPWDQKGYWAKQVEISILGTSPGGGPVLEKIAQGGNGFGNFTVTHFYAIHVFVLPMLTFVLLGLHIYWFRRAKVTPCWTTSEADLRDRAEPYWPGQTFRDVLASLFSLIIIAGFVIYHRGAALEAPADAGSGYMARPEWYAIPMYQLRMMFEGPMEFVATMIIPAVAGGAVAALPFIDRGPSRDPRKRLPVMAAALAGLVGIGALSFVSIRHDQQNPTFVKHRAEVEQQSQRARELAMMGVLPEGGLAVFKNDPQYAVREMWQEHCANCHGLTGTGGDEGPDLKDYATLGWIRAFLEDPQGPRFMGPAKKEKGMKPVEGTPEELASLTELVYRETGATDFNAALADGAKDMFSDKDCDSCHERDGQTEARGPNIKGWGTLAYVTKVIENAADPLLYGKRAKMPKFANKLSPEQIQLLAEFVLAQRTK